MILVISYIVCSHHNALSTLCAGIPNNPTQK